MREANRGILADLLCLEGKIDDLSARMMTKDDLTRFCDRIDGLLSSHDGFKKIKARRV